MAVDVVMPFQLPQHLRTTLPIRPARLEDDVLMPALHHQTPLPDILRKLREAVRTLEPDEQKVHALALLRLRLMESVERNQLPASDARQLAAATEALQHGRPIPAIRIEHPVWADVAVALQPSRVDADQLISLLLRSTRNGNIVIPGGNSSLTPAGVLDFLRYWLRSAERMQTSAPVTVSGPPVIPPRSQQLMLHPVVLHKDAGTWAWAASLLGWIGPLEREVVVRHAGVFVAPGLDLRNAISWAILEMLWQISRPTRLMVMLSTATTAPADRPSIPSLVASDLEWLPLRGPWEESVLPTGLPEHGRIRTRFAKLRDEKGLIQTVRVHIGIPGHENLHDRKPPFEEDVLKDLAERAWTSFREGILVATTAPETPGAYIE